MSGVYLTKARWEALQAFKRQPHLLKREFVAKDLMVRSWENKPLHPAYGMMMYSLQEAGWIERVQIAEGWGSGSPFRMGRLPKAWKVTDAGLKAIEECPDVFPGEPY